MVLFHDTVILHNLTKLVLSHNKITGTITVATIMIVGQTAGQYLPSLSLSLPLPPSLSELPPEIVELRGLEYLNLFNNHLEDLPSTISALPRLKELNIA